MKAGSAPRQAAQLAVTRVMSEGGYANLAVRAATRHLEEPDRALAHHLAYGTIRRLARLDRALAVAAGRPVARIEPDLLSILRVGAYELMFGSNPPHAAVDSAVETAGEDRGRRGFANAVLRRLAREGEPDLPNGLDGKALRLAAPGWLVERLEQDLGDGAAEAFLLASLEDPGATVRRRPGVEGPGDPVPGIEGAFRLAPVDQALPSDIPQDPASVAVGLAMDPEPRENVLDLAAAAGGKSMHLVDLGAGSVVAADVHTARVHRARKRTIRHGYRIPWVVADGGRPPFVPGRFEAVLVDAPCSGLGTLRRRPELRHRVTAAEIDRLGRLQSELVAAALDLVGPGGRVVYAVCTVTARETIEVVEAHRASAPLGLPGRPWGKGWLLAPHLTGTDGMFISLVSTGGEPIHSP